MDVLGKRVRVELSQPPGFLYTGEVVADEGQFLEIVDEKTQTRFAFNKNNIAKYQVLEKRQPT